MPNLTITVETDALDTAQARMDAMAARVLLHYQSSHKIHAAYRFVPETPTYLGEFLSGLRSDVGPLLVPYFVGTEDTSRGPGPMGPVRRWEFTMRPLVGNDRAYATFLGVMRWAIRVHGFWDTSEDPPLRLVFHSSRPWPNTGAPGRGPG